MGRVEGRVGLVGLEPDGTGVVEGDEERGSGEGLDLGVEAVSREAVWGAGGSVLDWAVVGRGEDVVGVGVSSFSCSATNSATLLVGAGVDSGEVVVLLSTSGDGTLGDERKALKRFFPFLIAGFFFAADATSE